MATFSPDGGVNEREPTLIPDNALRDTNGAEYRVGQPGVYVAKGRDKIGDVGALTGKGLYEAGFDGGTDYLILHEGDTYWSAPTIAALTFTSLTTFSSTTNPAVGTHHSNRHYLANSVGNAKIEFVGGVTLHGIGMSTTSFATGVSITQGSGLISANTGLEYWVTEYDSTRGIESLHGSTSHTGAISLKDGIVVIVTGTSTNGRADKLRWYRSTDGGGYPDGGLIQETAIGTTTITDANSLTGILTVPQYGIISIGGVDTDRDEAPGALSTIFGPYQDFLLGVVVAEPRVLRFTPAGYPDSWPSAYGVPLETERRDEIVTGVVLEGGVTRIGVFCKDSVHVIYRLPRDADSVFASGEAQEVVTKARGCVSRRGACTFTPPAAAPIAAWVARDGIWASNLSSSPAPVTDNIKWDTRVDVSNLSTCRLLDDPVNRRLIFIFRKKTDTTHNTGLWYIDYQRFSDIGMRITFADHGPLADAVTVAWTDGQRRALSLDSRASNGQVYVEGTQDADESLLTNASGGVNFRVRFKEFMPAGPRGTVSLGEATYMHDAGPTSVTHRFYHDRRDSNPEVKSMPDSDVRAASGVSLQRDVNSVSTEIESTSTTSYGVHWIDIEGLDEGLLGGRGGA